MIEANESGPPLIPISETILGDESSAGRSIFLARRGPEMPEFISFFGLGAPDKSDPDPYHTVEAISEVLAGRTDAPCLFAVYNTDPRFSADEARAMGSRFLDTETADALASSMNEADGLLRGRKITCSFESYSGALFLAMLVSSLKNPQNPVAARFLKSLSNTAERVAVMAPAIAISRHRLLSPLGLLNNYATHGNFNPLGLFFEQGFAKNEVRKMMTGKFLKENSDYSYHQMLKQYTTRAKHLILSESAYNENVAGLTLPDNIRLPKIIVIHQRKDNNVDYEITKQALSPLMSLELIEHRTAGGEFTGKDKHCLYADKENRPPLRNLIS